MPACDACGDWSTGIELVYRLRKEICHIQVYTQELASLRTERIDTSKKFGLRMCSHQSQETTGAYACIDL